LHHKNIEIVNKISKQISEIHPNRYIYKTKSTKELENLTVRLTEIPKFWKRNEQLLLNSWSLELLFLEFENRMYRIIGKSVDSVELLMKELIISKIQDLKQALNKFLKDFSKNHKVVYQKAELSELSDKNEIAYQFKKLLVSGFEKFKYLIERFPEKIELLTNDAFNNITEHQFEEIDTIEVFVSSMLDYVIQTELNKPLTLMAENMPKNVSELEQSVHNIQSLVFFTLFDNEGKLIDNENTPGSVKEFITKQITNLNKIEKQTENEIIKIHRKVNERLSEVSNHLHIYLLIKNAGESKSFAKRKLKEDKKRVFIKTSEKKMNKLTVKKKNEKYFN